MSQILDLVESSDPRVISHFFCQDCASELNINLVKFTAYLNPRYSVDWDLPWHEFHNVKYIYPELVYLVGDGAFGARCPCCGCNDPRRLEPMSGGLLDMSTIRNSLDAENEYVCSRCEGKFASHKCVVKVGRDYVCGDCIAFA